MIGLVKLDFYVHAPKLGGTSELINRRKNRNHPMIAKHVRDHTLIVTEELAIANMIATAKDTVEDLRSHVKTIHQSRVAA